MNSVELRALYRQFWRIGHKAVRHAIPAKYAIQDKIRAAFQASPPSAKKIKNTLEFLIKASESKGLEYSILKNLCRVHQSKKLYVKRRRPLSTLKPEERQFHEQIYDECDLTLYMLNETCGLCLR
ncbi:unnamed protein product [Pneumocystis jirovecii]|uniref:Uncharacterized protein n=1 Tax=Pneumocystis jirovecii TaxID=42068 RepID=L0PEX3_PNEJI|nr:unnamed protein product [Pneumocystis jirovecii]